MAVYLINCFEVPPGREEAFLPAWREGSEVITSQPGFIATRLHRSLTPDARFRFINYAQWESAEAHRAALNSDGMRAFMARPLWTELKKTYALYEAIHQKGTF
jgi:heme-degrading monooxygenase HmoA